MNEQRVNELFEKASRKIKGEGMVRQNVKFDENEEREKTISSERTDMKSLKNECSFLQDNWEVSLDYSIRPCNFVSKKMRQVLKKASKVLLGHYATEQNNINFSNKQCWEQMLICMESLQKENEQLRRNVEELTTEMERLKGQFPK